MKQIGMNSFRIVLTSNKFLSLRVELVQALSMKDLTVWPPSCDPLRFFVIELEKTLSLK